MGRPGVLLLTPWRRGPLLLLRRPGVAGALFAAAFVAALPAAAAPLFLSSAQNATLHRQIANTCPWTVGASVTNLIQLQPVPAFLVGTDFPVGAEVFRRRAAITAEAPAGLTGPVASMFAEVNADPIDRPSADPKVRGLSLVSRDGFADHVEVLAGPVGTGIWVPDGFAAQQGLRVGDHLRLSRRSVARAQVDGLPDPTPYDVTVAAVFRDLRSQPDRPFWCSLRTRYRGEPGQEFSSRPFLPMALLDNETFLAAGTALQLRAGHTIEYSVSDPTLTAPDATALASRITELRARVYTSDREVFDANFANNTGFNSVLGAQARRADLVREGLLPPVVPITAAGTLVGLAVVAASAVFWVRRRRQELSVLAAHGVSARAIGLKAVLEAMPAVLAGTAAGWAAGWLLVRWTGPGPVLSPGSVPLSALAAAATAVVAVLLVGLVAAGRSRALADDAPVTHAARWWRRLPWELALLAGAPAAWLTMADTRTSDVAGGVGDVAHVPARLLVVPILAIAGVVLLAARVGAGWLRSAGLTRTPRAPARLLAWRRIVRDSAATAMLAAATAVPIAMAAYGATVTDSIRTTSDAEVRMILGSDVVATLSGTERPPEVPPSLAGHAARVTRLGSQHLDDLVVDVVAVDPETFLNGAFWDDRMPGATLADAVRSLRAGPDPVVVSSDLLEPGDATLTLLEKPIPVRVADTRPLPGEQAGYPLVLIHQNLLPADLTGGGQLWIRGDPTGIRDEVAAARLPLARFTTIDDLRVGALHEPVTYTFQYLVALSVFTGLIAVVGLLLHLESRTAAHRRAYVLLRRLGLRPGAHRRALLVELGAPMLVGLTVGLGLATGLAYGLGASFEIDPVRPPGPILVLPAAMAAVVAVTALVVAVGAATLAQRRIGRANPAEVLRDTP